MLLIKTYIGPSKIHGIGLFAIEDIPKGTITWKFNPLIDIYFTEEELKSLPEITQNFIKEYGSLSIETHKYILSIDNARFTNHSAKPNLDTTIDSTEPERIAFANRNIKKDEELTINYTDFDLLSKESEYVKQNN